MSMMKIKTIVTPNGKTEMHDEKVNRFLTEIGDDLDGITHSSCYNSGSMTENVCLVTVIHYS